MKKLKELEKKYYKKQEKAIQEGLKARLIKTNCDCCKKEVNNEKLKYGYHDFYYVWDNKFLCEKCMIIQTFKDYPFIIGFLLLGIITIPFRMFYKMIKSLRRINLRKKLYAIISGSFSILWKFFRKLWDTCNKKYHKLETNNFEKAKKYHEKGCKYFVIADRFFQHYMYWQNKVLTEIKEDNIYHFFRSWKEMINEVEPDLRWLI